MGQYYNTHVECMPREQLSHLQLSRLQQVVGRVYQNVPYYRARMQQADLKPEDIRGLEDLKRLPFTVKQDLRDHYPYGTFAVPMEQIVRIHASSGTTGKPTVVGYTASDLANWGEVAARSLMACGATQRSIIQNAYGYGLFTGGLGIHYGAERLGAAVIPISGGNTQRQLMMLCDFGADVITCTPSYALYLAEEMAAAGIDPSQHTKLKFGVFGAEPWSEGMRRELEAKLCIRAHDIYGLSEITGPGVAVECECQNGMHIWEDHFLPEIIDPVTLQPLPDGQEGELVFTTITKEGIPLIRYRTRDISSLTHEKCACGRTHVRMNRVIGRTDDMLIIRGVNVFPGQIESVLVSFPEITPNYLLIVERVNNLDELHVQVEMSPGTAFDEVRQVEDLRRRIAGAIHSILGLSARVNLVEPNTLARSEGKAKRVEDRRRL